MIDGDPRVSERDGTRVVVDATGNELVCRRTSPHAHGTYHRIDCDQLAQDGTIHPVCQVTGADDANWEPVKRATIDRTWDGCEYQRCYAPDETDQRSPSRQLRTTLDEMSVEEFDAVTAQNGGDC